jgi:hypothetical protein
VSGEQARAGLLAEIVKKADAVQASVLETAKTAFAVETIPSG